MSFLAGEIYSIVGAKIREGDFVKAEKANAKVGESAEAAERRQRTAVTRMTANMEAFDRKQVAATTRVNAATERMATVQEATAARQRAAVARTAGAYEDATGRLRDANGRFVSSARQTERGLTGMGVAADRMAGRLRSSSTASTQLQTGLSKGLAGAVLVAGAVAVSTVKKYADLEQTLNVLKATTGATDRQMVRARQTAKGLGNDLTLPATSAKDAADAMTELAKGGLSITQSMKAARGVLQLSAAAQISNADAATIVADNLNAFNLKARDSVKVADLLAASANATTASIPEMGLALQQSAASAHQLGIPIEDLVTMLGELANAGIKGSDAGTSVKTMLGALTPNSAKAASAIKKLGVETFDAQGHFRGTRAVIEDYRQGLSKLTDEQKASTIETIFGSDASRAAAIILDGGVKSYDKLRGAVTKVGAAQDLAKAQMQGLNGAWEGFKSQIDTIQLGLGEKLAPALTDALRGVSDFLGEMQAGEGTGGAFLDHLEEVAGIARDDIAPALDAAKQAVDDFESALAGGGGDFAAIGNTLKGALSFLGEGLGGQVGDEVAAIGDVAQTVAHGVRAVDAVLRGDWSAAWDQAKATVSSFTSFVGNELKVVTSPIRALASALPQPFRDAADTILGLFSSLLSGAADVVGTMAKIPGIGGAFKGLASGIQAAADEIDDLRAGLRQVKPPDAVKIIVKADAKAASAALEKINGTKLENKVVKVLGSDADARSKINALKAMGIPPKTARVLANIGDALAGLSTVQQMMARLNGYVATATVRIQQQGTVGIPHLTQHPRKATGRGPGRSEQVLVGENARNPREAIVDPARGTAFMVDRPTIMSLPDTAYVIPEDPAYRGRAMGFLVDLAADLGLKGFRKGKAPSKAKTKAKRALPGDVQPTKLPLQEIEDKRNKAKTALDKAKATADRLPKNVSTTQAQIRDIKRRKPKTKAQKENKADDLARAEKKLATQRKELREARVEEAKQRKVFKAYEKERIQAVRFQAQITKQEQLADTAASEMRTADDHDDQGAYDKAKAKRLTALKALRGLLDRARRALADQDSEAARELDKTIATTDSDVADTEGQLSDADQGTQTDADRAAQEEADKAADTGMTKEERARLSSINKDIALAALTQPLDDDKAAAGSLVEFLEGILAAAPGRGISDDVIGDLAGQVKQARDNYTSLTTGGATNDNADLQAQLDQANERTRVATENARINAQALAVFGGSGDIGSGGSNAMTAARGGVTVNQTINTLHPGSPQIALALANTTAAGFGYQNPRPSKTQKVA